MNKTPTVILFNDSIDGACSFWRGQGAYNELAREGKINLITGEYGLEDWTKLRACDVAVFQRPMSQLVKGQIFSAKDMGLKIIIDLDDHNLGISPSHPVYDVWSIHYNEKVFSQIMLCADVVTVSTEYLQQHYLKYANDVIMIPNAINDYWLPFNKISQNKTVVLRAGDHHSMDVWNFKEEIIEVMQNHKDWKFYVMGGEIHFLKNKIDNMEFVADLDIHQYFGFIIRYSPSIFIVPLEDTELNRGKSNISWIESTLAGATALTPNFWKLSNYSASYKDKKTFKEGFEKLIADNELRNELYEKSLIKVRKDYLLSKVNNKRMEIIKNLMK